MKIFNVSFTYRLQQLLTLSSDKENMFTVVGRRTLSNDLCLLSLCSLETPLLFQFFIP